MASYYKIYSQEGLVYAVEFSHRSGRDLINVAKKRTNIIPIIEDARHPHKYRMLVSFLQILLNIVDVNYLMKQLLFFLDGIATKDDAVHKKDKYVGHQYVLLNLFASKRGDAIVSLCV